MGVRSRVAAAFDVSETANLVYAHNLRLAPSTRNLAALPAAALDALGPALLLMSPPCQPFTRSNTGARDDKDPRSAALLNVVRQLELMQAPPRYIALENVVGFEHSACCLSLLAALERLGYSYLQLQLSPAAFGVPNDRPRYYCLARMGDPFLDGQPNDPALLLSALPGHAPSPAAPLSECLETHSALRLEQLRVPDAVMRSSAAWCFDIVGAADRRSSCFTKAYSKFVRGAGSVLLMEPSGPAAQEEFLTSPEERVFDERWRDQLGGRSLRYFAPSELTRLFGFPATFEFPPGVSDRKSYELIGNSLSVVVARRLLAFLLRCEEESS